MNDLPILQAMLLLADALTYSDTYKQSLIDEINKMIEQEKTYM